MIEQVITTIEKYKMLACGDRVTVGLSGGADSVCLLYCLNELKEKYNLSLCAIHINHCLRGAEADNDQHFCEKLCQKLGIELTVCKIDVMSEIKNMGVSVEEGARILRYKAFEKYSHNAKIATAHNLDDVAETMIFNITRGCSVNGICSIPAVRDNIIRPLINTSRKEIELYLKKKSIDFVTDSTNLCDDYTRNKIRHNVIPSLKEINPAFLQSIKRLKENAEQNNDYFSKKVAKLNSSNISAKELRDLPKAILCEYIYRVCRERIGVSLESVHIEACIKALYKGVKCQLPGNNYFYVENNKVCFGMIEKQNFTDFCFELNGDFVTPYKKYKIEIVDYENYKKIQNVNNLFLNNTLDYDKICNNAIVRNKRAGDKVRLKNRNCTKLLKSVFNEMKIPLNEREKSAIILSDNKIAWVESVGVCDGFYPTKNTKKVLIISPEVDCY